MLKLKPVILICGKPIGSDAVIDAEIERIDLEVRREGDVDAIESEPRFVGQVWTKDVRLVEREDLPVRLPRIAKARQGVALKIRLAAPVRWKRVVAVDTIVIVMLWLTSPVH